ncbi:MAG: hypothetical protein IPG76_20375 [Acidobacteria bacterium]|nr:hypothetical protein [Acidobacteriota bacterium]
MFLACSGEGKVTVIRPGSALDIAYQADFDEQIFATPAFAGGLMYLRTDHHLYAFGTNNQGSRK